MVLKKEELLKLPVSTKRQRIATIAKQHIGEPLTLLHHYIDETWLKVAYHSLRKKSAPGIDRQTWIEYGENLEENVKSLLGRAKSGRYKAPAVRRVEIPKPGSKEKRKLGIPTIEDKVLQKAVLMILDPIYELEFYNFSYGFRTGKSQHQALEYLWQGIMGNNIQWIIDLDIRKFFDTVKHEILQELFGKRVRDGVITRLIGKWLKAGVLQDGSISYSDEGTPQGGIISPILSNIYLHEALDKWYAKVVLPRIRGRSIMARFADDAILGFETEEEATKVLQAIEKRFARYGLKLHPQKTRIVYFGRPKSGNGNSDGPRPGSFDFLGFTHFWGKSHKGNWTVKRKTSSKKFREKLMKMSEWCKKNRHQPLQYQYEKLCLKLKGHYAYYGITGNMRGLQRYLNEVRRIWKKWLNRRSWKGNRLNWERFSEMLKNSFPLPPARVVHSIYAQRNHNSKNRMR
jgi:group II intron reverse transcriptase/maturase